MVTYGNSVGVLDRLGYGSRCPVTSPEYTELLLQVTATRHVMDRLANALRKAPHGPPGDAWGCKRAADYLDRVEQVLKDGDPLNQRNGLPVIGGIRNAWRTYRASRAVEQVPLGHVRRMHDCAMHALNGCIEHAYTICENTDTYPFQMRTVPEPQRTTVNQVTEASLEIMPLELAFRPPGHRLFEAPGPEWDW